MEFFMFLTENMWEVISHFIENIANKIVAQKPVVYVFFLALFLYGKYVTLHFRRR
jgi:hypothetical protein